VNGNIQKGWVLLANNKLYQYENLDSPAAGLAQDDQMVKRSVLKPERRRP